MEFCLGNHMWPPSWFLSVTVSFANGQYSLQNGRVALTQVGLSQLHYQTMWIQANQLHCWSTTGPLRHANG